VRSLIIISPLLKTLEAAFDLSCLNHACDNGVSVMTDLFGK
jgi:hypothetical protein